MQGQVKIDYIQFDFQVNISQVRFKQVALEYIVAVVQMVVQVNADQVKIHYVHPISIAPAVSKKVK